MQITKIEVKNIKQFDGDDWRAKWNGEEFSSYQVNCDCCDKYEDESGEMYMMVLSDVLEFLLCDKCAENLRVQLEVGRQPSPDRDGTK